MTLKTVLDKGYGSQIAGRRPRLTTGCWRLKADGWLQTAAPHLHSTPTEPLSKKGGVKKWGVNNYGYSRDSQIAGRKSLNAADGCLLKADSRSQPQSLSFATCHPRPATRADCWRLKADGWSQTAASQLLTPQNQLPYGPVPPQKLQEDRADH